MDDPETIPVKSLSLRKTSVRKRLETEGKRKQPRTKGKLSKKARLSKYRRKSANAKERERMKKQNDVFEVLKEILPCDKAMKVEEDKETKVSTLRSAIQYIHSLESLLADCEAGRLAPEVLRQCRLAPAGAQAAAEVKTKKKNPLKVKKKVLGKKLEKIVEPKWTHYSKQDLMTKFDPNGTGEGDGGTIPLSAFVLAPPDPPPYTVTQQALPPPPPYRPPTVYSTSPSTTTTYLCQAPTTLLVAQTTPLQPSPPSPGYIYTTTAPTMLYTSPGPSSPCSLYSPTPSSPRDVNEISLHISLIDSRTQLLTF